MSLNNWKLLNQFRDTIVRLANDESFQTLLKKNSQQIYHRFSSVGEIFKSLELKSTTLPSVIVKKDHTKSEHKWKNSLAVSRVIMQWFVYWEQLRICSVLEYCLISNGTCYICTKVGWKWWSLIGKIRSIDFSYHKVSRKQE